MTDDVKTCVMSDRSVLLAAPRKSATLRTQPNRAYRLRRETWPPRSQRVHSPTARIGCSSYLPGGAKSCQPSALPARRRLQSLAMAVSAGKAWRIGSPARATCPHGAGSGAGSDTKRLTLRWRSSDQYPLCGSFECRSGVTTTPVESCVVVSTAFHSSARLRVSSATSSLDSLVMC